PLFSFLTGIVSALVPIIAQHLGKGDRDKIREEFHQFVYLAIGLTMLLLCSVLFIAVPSLAQFGLDESVFKVGRQYL
ncbi:MATE family efflux transporter, partial [Streptococcus suis]